MALRRYTQPSAIDAQKRGVVVLSHKQTITEALGRDPVHPFPARMAPGIALDILRDPDKSLRVLDPMMGSGTVLAVARAQGHHAMGVDIDPLAVLISRVWTTAINPDKARKKADDILMRAKRNFKLMSVGDAYPRHSDAETRRFVAYWFDGYARRQLASLANAIAGLRDETIRNVLWCAFFSINYYQAIRRFTCDGYSHTAVRTNGMIGRRPSHLINSFQPSSA